MYVMHNVLCFLGGRCFYFSRSALGTFCEEEFAFEYEVLIFEFEVLNFKLHFFLANYFFLY